MNEALDIERRKFNLVINGMPVLNDTSDVDLVKSLLEDPVLEVTGTVHVNNVQRVGNKGLMIISFEDLDSKRSVLKSAHKLRSSSIPAHKDIYISPDLTKKQRQAEYNLRVELKMRKDNGETGLKISKGKIIHTNGQTQGSSTPQVIRVVTSSRVPHSTDTRVHVQNSPNGHPGRKLLQQPVSHIVKVGDFAFKPAASGSAVNGSCAPVGASGTMGKN